MKKRLHKLVLIVGLLLVVPIIHSEAAVLNIQPSTQRIYVGDTFSVRLVVDSENTAINSSEAQLSYPSDMLDIVSVSKVGSIFTLWVEDPIFSNANGTLSYSGGVPSPGYTGSSGQVLTVIFKAKKSGEVVVTPTTASVRADDGNGTDVLLRTIPARIQISEKNEQKLETGVPRLSEIRMPTITSTTHPDQSKWYRNSSPIFSWTTGEGVVAVRMLYDNNPSSNPTVTYQPPIDNKQIPNIEDGVHYFHVQVKTPEGWSQIAHYRFNIDTVAPRDFNVKIADVGDSESRPRIVFSTTDAGSGMARYEVSSDNTRLAQITASEVGTPIELPVLDPGTRTIVVSAYDNAGNIRQSAVEVNIPAIDAPVVDSYNNELTEKDTLKIVGQSYPLAQITIQIKDEHGEVTEDSVKANNRGQFNIVWTKPLLKGTYSFVARATNSQGIRSYPTDDYPLVVKQKFISEKGSLFTEYLSMILTILVMLGAIAYVGLYIFRKLAALRKKLYKDIVSTEHSIHVDIEELRDEINQHILLLETAKKKRVLTKEEQAIFKSLKNAVNQIESDISKKITTIKRELE